MKKKLIAVLLVVIMLASMGTPVLAETTETTNYNVWVGGVQVTSANKDNVLDDDGTPTVTYAPATETDWAKLTLTGASVTGANLLDLGVGSDDINAAIYAGEDLEIVISGENTLTATAYDASCTAAYDACCTAIFTYSNLKITGEDPATDILNAIGADVPGYITCSCGIYGVSGITIKDVAVNATGKNAENSYGIISSYDIISIENSNVTAQGYDGAFMVVYNYDLTLTGCKVTAASRYYDGSKPVSVYNSEAINAYKYIEIAPSSDEEGGEEEDDGTVKYDVWVGGVQITDANKDNVLDDEGTATVTYTPATQTDWAKLTLTGASVTGANLLDLGVVRGDYNAAIYAKENLEIIVLGENTLTAAADGFSCFAIVAESDLKITGEYPATDSLYAVAADCSGASCGINVQESITIKNVTVNAIGKSGYYSYGVNNTETFSVENSNVKAQGYDRAYDLSYNYGLTLTGCKVTAASRYYDGSRPVSVYISEAINAYKYIEIALSSDEEGGEEEDDGTVKYDVWVGGVQITDANKDNVLGDDGTATVTYIPATGNNWAKLTLTGASVTGANLLDLGVGSDNINAAIYAKENLEIIVLGENTITAEADGEFCCGIHARGLNITGESCANDILNAIGADSTDDNGYSYGIHADLRNIKNVTVNAIGKKGVFSYGVSSDQTVSIENSNVKAQGYNRAFYGAPTLKDCVVIKASENYDGSDPVPYKSADISSYQYIEIGILYPVWVGGVLVTGINKDNIPVKSGTATYTPATGDDWAKLTLTGATIEGANLFSEQNYAIYANENLEIIVSGENTLTTSDAGEYTSAIRTSNDLKIIGENPANDILNAVGADCTDNFAISCGINTRALTIKDVTVNAIGKSADYSYGFIASSASVENSHVKAQGYTNAFANVHTLTDCEVIKVSENYDGTNPVTYNADDIEDYQYLEIGILYPVWVGGVQVTSANKDNVLDDDGTPTVTYTPATETDRAKLTLTGATIVGAAFDGGHNYGIYAKEDIELAVSGTNTVTATTAGDSTSCYAVNTTGALKITGNSHESDSLTATAPAIGTNGTSIGIKTAMKIEIKNATVNAVGQAASVSRGIDAEYSYTVVQNAAVKAQGTSRAISRAPTLTGCEVIKASTSYDGSNPVEYNAADIETYKYLEIAPTTKYPVWVGGVQVTSANMDNVLSDDGTPTVTYAPATETDRAKLTLTGATIVGAAFDGGHNYGIYAKEDIELAVSGTNTVTATTVGDSTSCYAVNTTGALKITGNSHESDSLTATAPATGTGGISIGIRATGDIEIKNVYVNAVGQTATASRGIGTDGAVSVKKAAVIAQGNLNAFNKAPALTDCAVTKASVNYDGANPAAAYDSASITGYKYIEITPTAEEEEDPDGYPVWVGGVQVTSANKDNVLDDDGTPTVTYAPATETDWAKLTLTGATIEGVYTVTGMFRSTIYANEDLEIVVSGENTVTATTTEDKICQAIYTDKHLKITGSDPASDSLNAIGPDKDEIYAFLGNQLTSYGILATYLTIENVTVNAIGRQACSDMSYGIVTGDSFSIENSHVKAKGYCYACHENPDLTDCEVIKASENYDGSDPVEYNADYIQGYKYLEIVPTTKYPVWVGGVQVTSANKDNVLDDDGTPTVTYAPATETDCAKLTLTGAEIEGAYLAFSNVNAAIIAQENLEIAVSGENTLTAMAGDGEYSVIMSTLDLKITGENKETDVLKSVAADCNGYSYGIYVAGIITIKNVTVSAIGQEGRYSCGIVSPLAPVIENSHVTAQGYNSAFSYYPDLTGCEVIKASTSYNGSNPVEYNTADIQTYKYLEIGILYPVWVGGVQVTSANKDNVLSDEGTATVTYTPATEDDCAQLTLTGAEIEGANLKQLGVTTNDLSAAIYSTEALEIIVSGENTLTAAAYGEYRSNIYILGALKITGEDPEDDSLTATKTGVCDSYFGINAYSLTIKDVTVNVIDMLESRISAGILTYAISIENSHVKAQVYSNAFQSAPTLTGCEVIKASTSYNGSNPVEYNADNINSYKYLEIAPPHVHSGVKTNSEWETNENYHWKKYCSVEGCPGITAAELENNTALQTAVSYGAHSYSWGYDAAKHRQTCSDCGDVKNEGNHSFTYAVDSDNQRKLVESCTNTSCGYNKTATLTATDAVYTGSAYTGASLSKDTGFHATTTIYYEGTGETTYTKSETAPTAVGTYKASVTCGAATVEASFAITVPPHVHSGVKTNSEWETNENYHWKKYCSVEGCPGITAAELENNTALQTAVSYGAHSYSWQYDNANHWQECSTCENEKDKAAHTFTYAVDSDNQRKLVESCTTTSCEYSKTATLTATDAVYTGSAYTGASLSKDTGFHATTTIYYEGTGETTYTKSETAPTAVGTYKASVTCGDATVEASFEITVPPHVHSGVKTNSEWETNENYHWKKYCSVEGCPGITAAELENNTALQTAVSYGTHSYSWGYDAAKHRQTCSDCGDVKNEGNHTFTYAVDSDNQRKLVESCTTTSCEYSKTATLTATNAVYTGSAYTGASLSKDTGFHATTTIYYEGTGETTYTKSETAPTAVGTYKASVTCGEATVEASFAITVPPHVHSGVKTNSEWETNDTHHWKKYCSVDGCPGITAAELENDTALQTAVSYGAHSYSWGYDASKHRQTCSDCGDVKNEGNHTFTYAVDSDNQRKLVESCTTTSCGYNKTATLTATNTVYTGSAYTGASLSKDTGFHATTTIYYEGTGETTYTKSETAPTAVGTYKASVTCGDATVEASFAITVPPHVHSGVKANSEWETNENYHWKKYCSVEGCPGITAAELENDTALQTAVSYGAHSYSWGYDASKHRQTCSGCRDVKNEANHSFTYALDSSDASKIIESCTTDGCAWNEYIKIKANNATFTGSEYAGATVEKSTNLHYSDTIEITYYVNLGRSTGTTTPPTEIGNYIAQIEVAGITATCEFSITEASPCHSVKTVSPKDGTLQMYSGDTYMGEYTFARKGSGWTICGEDGLYLTVSNGKLAYSETPTVWTYRNNAFSYSTSSRSFFWFSSGKTYYLTANGVSTRSARITLKEEVSLSEHDFAVIMNRDGTHSHTCNNCGYSETEDCDFSVWTKDTGKNTHSRACTVCGYKETASCEGETECEVCGGEIITESCSVSVNVTKRTSSGWYRRQTTYSVTIKVDATEMKVRTVEYSRDGKRWTRGTSFTSQTAVDKLYIRVNGEKLFYYNGTTVTPQ